MTNSNQDISVKLINKGIFRRFILRKTADSDLFSELLKKVQMFDPEFSGHLAWQDSDGDLILFSSEEELLHAIRIQSCDVFRIVTVDQNGRILERENGTTNKRSKIGEDYQKDKRAKTGEDYQKISETEGINLLIICDYCDRSIDGILYECVICSDFHLCGNCEKRGSHGNHPLIRYANLNTPRIGKFMKSLINEKNYQCLNNHSSAIKCVDIFEKFYIDKHKKKSTQKIKKCPLTKICADEFNKTINNQKNLEKKNNENSTEQIRLKMGECWKRKHRLNGSVQKTSRNIKAKANSNSMNSVGVVESLDGIKSDLKKIADETAQKLTSESTDAMKQAAWQAASSSSEILKQAASAAAQQAAIAASALHQELVNLTETNENFSPLISTTFANGMDYLMEVGNQIQQALINFGIDVDIDIEHNGVTERIKQSEVKEGVKNDKNTCTDQEVLEDNGDDAVNDSNGDQKDLETRLNDIHISSHDNSTDEQLENAVDQNSSFDSDEQWTVLDQKCIDADKGELLNTSQSLCSFYPDISSQKISEDQNDLVARVNFSQIPFKDSFDGSKSPIVPLQTDEQWIDMANSSEMRNNSMFGVESVEVWQSDANSNAVGNICMAGTPFFHPSDPHSYRGELLIADKNVRSCIDQLEVMGFDNCNGWLTKLAIEFNGDIDKVIEEASKDPIYVSRIESTPK